MNEPEIIYSDRSLAVVNKPAGLLVHSSSYQKTKEPTLVEWLLKKFPEIKNVGDEPKYRPGIVHRLDKETSGVMLVPLTQENFSYLKKLFQEKGVKKTYLAVVRGWLKESKGIIEKSIGIKSGTTRRTVYSSKMAKEAITEYELVKNFEHDGEKMALVKIYPRTGRTHQIRVHMNYIGHPVIGDALYGGRANSKLAPRQMLHCLLLEFVGESGQKARYEAEPPEDFKIIAGKAL
jgi:23S rRNA pseudouridine1911/1915/1917 synthase